MMIVRYFSVARLDFGDSDRTFFVITREYSIYQLAIRRRGKDTYVSWCCGMCDEQ